MDLHNTKAELLLVRRALREKGAPIADTATGHLLLALEELVEQLEEQFGYSRKQAHAQDFFRTE